MCAPVLSAIGVGSCAKLVHAERHEQCVAHAVPSNHSHVGYECKVELMCPLVQSLLSQQSKDAVYNAVPGKI